MLMTIGPVRFEVAPLNPHKITHAHGAHFAEKAILGTRPGLEWVGESGESWTVTARLHPEKFGGLGDLEKLRQARAAGLPQYMMRGDGTLMGWVVIDNVTEKSSHLDGAGVGRVIEVDIVLRRSGGPSAGRYFSVLVGLFT